MRLENKVALFTGANSEIAMAAEKLFLQEGCRLVLAASREKTAAQLKETFAYAGDSVAVTVGDVTDYSQMTAALDFALQKYGKVDILVNSAGIARHSPIADLPLEDWRDVINVNLTGVFYACKAVAPYMKKNGYGRIVNVTSVAGRTGRPKNGVNYAASKGGVISLTQTLALELAPFGVTVNCVAPGPCEGRMIDAFTDEIKNSIRAGVPIGRIGRHSDIGYGILYLATDEAEWVTGEVLDINGGIYI